MPVDIEALKARFAARFGATPRVFSAPGRVNLIGEHTDYNEGFVLPLAIERRTYVAAAVRDDRRVTVFSEDLGAAFALDLERPGPPRRGVFGDYIEGVARALLARGFRVPGADLLVSSEVPGGAGLSSSAALELSVGFALAVLGGEAAPDRVGLALAGQRAEHEYVGTECGIMDQLVAALGRAGHALLIDCRSLTSSLVSLPLGDAELVVCDTRAKHALAASAYNRRRSECREGVRVLAAALPGVTALRDVSANTLAARAALFGEGSAILRRCRHVVTENARTLAAAEALAACDLDALGRLMVKSHVSLRDDYEVSCPELDLAVDTALAVPGVRGARMTGGGFGGSTVTLCARGSIPDLERALTRAFEQRFGTRPVLFAARAADGVRTES